MSAQHGQQDTVTLLGVGDVGRGWHHFEAPESIYAYVAPVIRQADIAFAQMEGLWTERGEFQVQVRQTQAGPRDADEAKRKQEDYSPLLAECGFDVVSVAGNHGLDYGPAALLENIENLRRVGIAVAGGGKNIQEARAPAILERKGIRVAFLAYVSVILPGYAAEEHAAGMAPMRAHTLYEPLDYQPGTHPIRIITTPHREDLEALGEDVRKAKTQADVVILSFHWGLHHVPRLIADYQIDVAHAAIDAGADLILGHHPHILKGIEMYKGKVCFYSLCNFLMAGSGERVSGHKSREIYNMPGPDPEYPFYNFHPDAKMSAAAKCLITKEGIQRVSYLPLWVNGQAQPRILSAGEPEFEQTVSYIRDISQDYFKTSFQVEGDEVLISSP